MLRITVYKETKDEWYPVYGVIDRSPNTPLMLVEVTLVSLMDGKTRVCVWGGDDFGLEKDFDSEEIARQTFQKVIEFTTVDQKSLRELGFINA